MAWFFKRSVKFGPFRLNLSKSGIGVSAGIRGARVSTGPRGTYINVGSKGLYYRQKIGQSPATSTAGGIPSTNPIPYQGISIPPILRYPAFPKHGPPRIVTTLGLLSIPALVVLVWIWVLVVVGSSSSSGSRQHDNSSMVKKVVDTPLQTNRERGFRAGFDYAISTQAATRDKKLYQLRPKQLAAQMAAKEQEGQDWQQGWIEGYARGSDKSIGSNTNDNRDPLDQPAPRATPPTAIQQFRTASNGYIRGPRGGCYYLSASGRKVYVDRGLCN